MSFRRRAGISGALWWNFGWIENGAMRANRPPCLRPPPSRSPTRFRGRTPGVGRHRSALFAGQCPERREPDLEALPGPWRRTPNSHRGAAPRAGGDEDYGSGSRPRPCPRRVRCARDLDQLLGQAFAGPEVGAVKPLITVHDRDQGDLGEVVALGSIWEPTRMSASPSAILASTRSQAASPRTASRSMRSTRASGKCSRSDSTTRSVPCPTLHRKALPHSGQPIGTGR